MKTRYYFAMIALAGAMTACNADMDVDIPSLKVSEPKIEELKGTLVGDDYEITWPATEMNMEVTRYANGGMQGTETVSEKYVHHNADTNVDYTYVLKNKDKNGNLSKGVIMTYNRPGASVCSNIEMMQVEGGSGFNIPVKWSIEGTNATKIYFRAYCDKDPRVFTKEYTSTESQEYLIEDVKYGQTWTVELRAENEKGTSLPVTQSLRIGSLAVAYLSMYDTPEELIANGDDDEAYGWIWFKNNYPNGAFLPFSSICDITDIESYRVLFFMRDIDDVAKAPEGKDAWGLPAVVETATPIITQWYKDGGNLLLWGHATTYVGHLGRIKLSQLKSLPGNISYGGGYNQDTWKMSVQLNTGKFVMDNSTHPLFKGLDVEDVVLDGRATKLLPVKSGAYTEDHNCLYFDLPIILTGIGNEEEACYNSITGSYGIVPLGTWDSQCRWISQLNVWECRPANSGFKGTVICVGNGGCNFYLKQDDGSFDVEKKPSANQYQSNLETMAKNAIEYLKTR